MPLIKPTGPLALLTALATACATDQRPSQPTLTQAALRAELERHTCTTWLPEANLWNLHLFAPECITTATSGPLGPLVRASVTRLQPLRMLADPAYDSFYDPQDGKPPLPRPQAESLADAAMWSDPLLHSAIWTAIHAELAARRLTCSDCPTPTPPPTVTIAWSELSPYFAAFIWPHQPPDGGPVQIYTCSGVNGVAALPPNPTLTQAGKLIALAFVEHETTRAQIAALNAGSLPDVERALATYLATPDARAFACDALADVAWFTGVRVRDC